MMILCTYRRISHTPTHLIRSPIRRTVSPRKATARAHLHFVRRRIHGHRHAAGKVLLELQRLDGVEGRRRVNGGCRSLDEDGKMRLWFARQLGAPFCNVCCPNFYGIFRFRSMLVVYLMR